MKKGTPKGLPLAWLMMHVDFDEDDCLLWPFSHGGRGYGRLRIDGRLQQAHRIMCKYRHGPPPTPVHEAAHSCGNGHLGCVHPMHVSWKTPKENQADKIIHGTSNRGNRSARTKLTQADVLAIRAAEGTPHRLLAIEYGVAESTISCVIRRHKWAWL